MFSQDRTNEEFDYAELFPQEVNTDNTQNDQSQPPEEYLSQTRSDQEDLDHLKNQEELVLAINPTDLPSGHVSVRQLTHIAGGLQDLADSTANTIYNQPSEKGKIPEDILESTKMILSDIQPDAFKAVLNIKHPEQTSLEQPDIIETLKELFNLFDVSNEDNQLAAKIASLGPRTFRVYADLTKSLAELDTPVTIEWHSAYNNTLFAAFDPEQADKIYQTLDNLSNTNEDITVKGTFTGANIRTGTFELITEEGEQISGKINKDAAPDLLTLKFNQTYTVELLKIRVTGPDIQDKVSWTLKDITPV